MTKYFIRRFLGIFPTLLVIISICFFMIRLAPGGPFDSEKALPQEILVNIEKKYHMDEPLVMQFGRYVISLCQGDLGPSFRYHDYDVNELIFGESFKSGAIWNSMTLGVCSLFVALLLGISTGMISALKQNSWLDYLPMSFAIVGISIPTFVVGPILMFFFALQWKLLPTSGWIYSKYGIVTIIMPVITLALPYFAFIARLTRASVLETLRSDYVRTARAKGLSSVVVMAKHVLKGSMLPIVSFLGPAFAGILTGSVVVETIFRVPGLGKFFVQSAFNRDYTLIMGTVIVYATLLVVMNFLVDIAYSFLDPRVTYK